MVSMGWSKLGMMRLLFILLSLFSFSAQAETPLINCNGTSFLQSKNNPPQWVCGTPAGSVTITGTPANGNLTKFSGATSITNGNLSGDVTTSGSLATTLATVNSNVGTFQGLTLNAKGLVTAASNQGYLTGNQTITLSGDTTGSGATAITTTTGKVNGVSYGASPSTNTVPVVTGTNAITYETVPNAALANSSTTVNGQTCTLGSTCTISAGSGTVTNVIDSSGFFSIATSTTTPTFTFANAPANTVFGNNTNGSATPGFQTSINISGTAATAADTITSASANALTVGANGTANPTLNVDDSTASSVTGINIKSAATGGTTTIQATDSGANSGVSLLQKGTGVATIGNGTGNITLNGSGTFQIENNGTPTFTINSSSRQISLIPMSDLSSGNNIIHFLYTQPTDSSLLTTAEVPIEEFNNAAGIRTHATGAITLQRDFILNGATDAFTASSTLTDGATFGISLKNCGTNATCTNESGFYHASTALTGAITNSYVINAAADTGATNNYVANLVGSVLMSGGSGLEVGTPTGGLKGAGTTNATSVYQNGTQVVDTAGTGLSKSGTTLNSNAVYQMSFQPGLITSITNTISVFSKVSNASTVDNLIGSASSFSCVSNPTITMYECGTSTTCTSPTTIGTVTITAAGTAATGTVSSAAITAGDFVGFAISSGTCTSLDISATAQVHSN